MWNVIFPPLVVGRLLWCVL